MGKAVIFSIVSLLIVILFVASSNLITKFKINESELEITRARVKMLNSVASEFESSYFEKLLYIASKNSIVGLSRYYAETDYDQPNLKKSLEQAMNDVIYQGMLYDNKGDFQANLSDYIDYEYTISGLMNSMGVVMDRLGLEMSEFNVSISPIDGIIQSDPWTIQVKGEFTYFINDKNGIASWKGFSEKTVNVSVIGFYLYDRQGGPNSVSNKGIITKDWKLDNGTITEDSVIRKLAGKGNEIGLCVSYCQEE